MTRRDGPLPYGFQPILVGTWAESRQTEVSKGGDKWIIAVLANGVVTRS